MHQSHMIFGCLCQKIWTLTDRPLVQLSLEAIAQAVCSDTSLLPFAVLEVFYIQVQWEDSVVLKNLMNSMVLLLHRRIDDAFCDNACTFWRVNSLWHDVVALNS